MHHVVPPLQMFTDNVFIPSVIDGRGKNASVMDHTNPNPSTNVLAMGCLCCCENPKTHPDHGSVFANRPLTT